MIEVELPDGRVLEIETDDPAQAAQAAKQFISNQQPAEESSFIDSAKDVAQTGLNVASEAASAVNRGASELLDFFTTDQLNAISRMAGNDLKLPGFTEKLSSATEGGQMKDGLAKDVVRTAGEFVAPVTSAQTGTGSFSGYRVY